MEEQMINMLSLIVDQVTNKQELFDEEARIMQALVNGGYHIHEADAALMLMQNFVQKQSEELLDITPASPLAIRTMNGEERARFSIEAFAYLTKLCRLGILSADQREGVIEKALTVYPERIALEHMKSLIALIMFAPLQQDESESRNTRRYKKTIWN